MTCPTCNDERWVCEDHPTKPWPHEGRGGAGVPCWCNTKAKVAWRRVYADNGEPEAEPTDGATMPAWPPTRLH